MDSSRLSDLLFSDKPVYGLQIDSLMREIAEKMPAYAFMAFYLNADSGDPQMEEKLREMRDACQSMEGNTVVITHPHQNEARLGGTGEVHSCSEKPPITIPLKITFSDLAAARFSFEVFPALDLHFVAGCTRVQRSVVHYLLLSVPDRDALQIFVERCRRNPWVKSVDELPESEVRAQL